jgi:hypothetical protein
VGDWLINKSLPDLRSLDSKFIGNHPLAPIPHPKSSLSDLSPTQLHPYSSTYNTN